LAWKTTFKIGLENDVQKGVKIILIFFLFLLDNPLFLEYPPLYCCGYSKKSWSDLLFRFFFDKLGAVFAPRPSEIGRFQGV